jgi:hypothetical protein
MKPDVMSSVAPVTVPDTTLEVCCVGITDLQYMPEAVHEVERRVRAEALAEADGVPCAALEAGSWKTFRTELLAWARGFRTSPPSGCVLPQNLGVVCFVSGMLSYRVPQVEARDCETGRKRKDSVSSDGEC